MDNKFHTLPPLKRFKLIQQQQQQQKSEQNPENNTTPSCLPAKKRPHPPPMPTALCLPAKKRIWAVHPFDLNLDYQPSEKPEKTPPQDLENNPPEAHQIKENDDDDDGIICSVCGSTDGDPTDPIVLCDGCDLMVHANCYGHPFTNGIPEGDWFCAQCLESKKSIQDPAEESNLHCCLCPKTGGALKATTDGRWAHLVCAIYVPEVFFVDPEGREGVDCSKVLKRRWENKCCVCGLMREGCVIDCSEPKCGLGFHVSCGLEEEFCVEYRQGRRSDHKGGVVAAFCRDHTHLWKKQEQTGKFKIVARDD